MTKLPSSPRSAEEVGGLVEVWARAQLIGRLRGETSGSMRESASAAARAASKRSSRACLHERGVAACSPTWPSARAACSRTK